MRSNLKSSPASSGQIAVTELQIEARWLRALVWCGCAYEVFALSTSAVPTVSHYCRQYPLVGGIVLSGLALHFYYERQLTARIMSIVARAEARPITRA